MSYDFLVKKAGKQNEESSKIGRRTFLRRLAGFGLLLSGGVALDAFAIEPHNIETTCHDAIVPRLPRSLDGFTIAQLSDLHRSRIVPDSLIREAVRIVNSFSPDLAIITGDFVNRNADNAKPCAKMLSQLTPRRGAFAVLGNHDHWTDAEAVTRALEGKDTRVLMNESLQIAPGLALLGVDDFWAGRPDFDRTWRDADPEAAHVFLCHNPLATRKVSHRSCLMISGHTHGGQVHIPFVPRRHLPGLRGSNYIQGWYQAGDVKLYVNRGIGMINPPIRFMCRPEVTLFTLRSESRD